MLRPPRHPPSLAVTCHPALSATQYEQHLLLRHREEEHGNGYFVSLGLDLCRFILYFITPFLRETERQSVCDIEVRVGAKTQDGTERERLFVGGRCINSRVEGQNRGRLGQTRDVGKNDSKGRTQWGTSWIQPQTLNHRSGRENWKLGEGLTEGRKDHSCGWRMI